MEEEKATQDLATMAAEGLDAILLTLKDVAASPNQEDLRILSTLTSGEGGGMSKMRGRYLDADQELAPATRALMYPRQDTWID